MNLPTLAPADFDAYFAALWGSNSRPFPWQTNLLQRVISNGWPETLDIPTGCGKTSVLDIAVFALALDASTERASRRTPLRTVFVIDRRVVVDQAYERAIAIANKLDAATDGVLKAVADRLRSLSGSRSTQPLAVGILRGGMPRDTDWARRPDQPCILVSTVDQVGSRLLFRGYGVTPSMRPVHAGLLGEDVLYLLDEVHLSRPFHDTLLAVRNLGSRSEQSHNPPRRFECVAMSATPGSESSEIFALTSEDWAHNVLQKRLRSSKPASLHPVKTAQEPAKARDQVADACVRAAERLFEQVGDAQTCAIVVNRVETARRAAELAEKRKSDAGWQVHLITGRMRPLDRNELMRELEPRLRSGAERNRERTLVVSTQAIEAGADFDFDLLVTECASLDALRQRFGRLNRLGEFPGARAVIVGATTQLIGNPPLSDPVYGHAMGRTWQWLSETAETIDSAPVVDFGIEALENRIRSLPPDDFALLLATRSAAPVMLPAYVDLWSQTQPQPDADPDVAEFLHGPEITAPDVQIVWRADLDPDWLKRATKDERIEQDLTRILQDMLDACPPSPLEALPVPVYAAREWLAGVAAGETRSGPRTGIADIEGAVLPDDEAAAAAIAPFIVWRGDECEISDDRRALRPGTTIIVPTRYGGIWRHNWNPAAIGVLVHDRGDEAQLLHRGRAMIRWDERVVRSWLPPSVEAPVPQVDTNDEAERGVQAARDAFEMWRNALRTNAEQLPAWLQLSLTHLESTRLEFLRIEVGIDADTPTVWRAVTARRRVSPGVLRQIQTAVSSVLDTLDAFSDEDTGQFVGKAILLAEHSARVRDHARQIGASLGLDSTLLDDLCLAAAVHDIGKIDPRCQLMLHNADAVSLSLADEPLAKSGVPHWNRAERERSRRLSGYPAKVRHELLSAALAARSQDVLAKAADLDLVLHLVASHHGHCRPFAPLVPEDYSEIVRFSFDGMNFEGPCRHDLARIDSDVVSRFWRVTRRYGWWRIAWLEALLRLADHCASAEEEANDVE